MLCCSPSNSYGTTENSILILISLTFSICKNSIVWCEKGLEGKQLAMQLVTAAETNAQLGTPTSIWMRYECVVPINHKTEKIPNIPTIIS